MSKERKVLMFIFVALVLDDICRYIKALCIRHVGDFDYFSLLCTKFEYGKVYNFSLIYIVSIALIYFLLTFFKKPDLDF